MEKWENWEVIEFLEISVSVEFLPQGKVESE